MSQLDETIILILANINALLFMQDSDLRYSLDLSEVSGMWGSEKHYIVRANTSDNDLHGLGGNELHTRIQLAAVFEHLKHRRSADHTAEAE